MICKFIKKLLGKKDVKTSSWSNVKQAPGWQPINEKLGLIPKQESPPEPTNEEIMAAKKAIEKAEKKETLTERLERASKTDKKVKVTAKNKVIEHKNPDPKVTYVLEVK